MIPKEPATPVTTASYRLTFSRSLNCDGRYGIALAIALAVLLLPLAGGATLTAAWRYARAPIAGGEWWRLLTAHIVHLDARHALLNAAGLALLWALFARSLRPWQWALAVVVIVAVIDAALWFLSPRVQWYVGASALLHGIFACGAMAMIRGGERLGWVAAIAFAVKLGWEQLQGPLPMSGGPVLAISHVYGAAGGVVAGLLLRPRRQRLY
jgi:rhomboid family GlyGly-CTERM serine protease